MTTPGERILDLWSILEGWPGGERAFGLLLGRLVPYSGTISPRVRRLEPGRCVVAMKDRRRVRNHLDSVHAVALANLGELATGLATVTTLSTGVRGIVTGLEVDYEKKARGVLTARCRSSPPPLGSAAAGSARHRPEAAVRDADGDTVATVRATWRLSPRE